MIDQDFASLERVALESWLGRVLTTQATQVSNAWASSAIIGALRHAGRKFAAWPVQERARVAALIVGWAAVSHWLLLAVVVPPYVAPGIPRQVFLVIGLLAFATAAAANWVVEAWPQSAIGRFTNWLVR